MEYALVALLLGTIVGMIAFRDDYEQFPGLLDAIIWGVVPAIGFSIGLIIRKALRKACGQSRIADQPERTTT